MQLQARFASKLLVDHVRYSSIQHHLRIHNVHLLRSSACIQCPLHFQLRRLSDAPKGAPPQDESLKELNTSQSTPNTLLDGHGSDLPSARAGRRHDVTKRISHLMDNLQGNIFIASQRINDLTGYSSIEELKKQITMLETKVQDAQQAVRTARLTYKTTVTDRASTQREVTTLLARKDSWTPSDLERFTALYRMDHSNEQAVQEAATRLADAESNMEHLAHQLRSSILARYHEEQIWSDKIRRMSTWGTWVLMGVNVLLFLVFQFGFEPWRRKRLVQGFEEKVREALEQVKLPGSSFTQIDELQDPTGINKHQEPEESAEDENLSSDISSHLASVSLQGEDEEEDVELEGSTTFNVREAFSPTTQRINYKAKVLDRYVAATKELFSDGIVEMRKQDILIIALEGAAVGATIATILNTFIRSA